MANQSASDWNRHPANKPSPKVDSLNELSSFEQLPEMIIEQIISNLGHTDALNLLLLNKNINEVISNNFRIMSRFELKMPETDDKFRTGGFKRFLRVRRYSKIHFPSYNVKGIFLKAIVEFLSPYAPFIKRLTFNRDYFEASAYPLPYKEMLVQILKVCCNIETLEVYGYSLSERALMYEAHVAALKLPNLRNLIFPANGLLGLFKKCQLNSLSVVPSSPKCGSKFIESLLLTQRQIEHLCLPYNHNLFNDALSMKTGMKLKSLAVCNYEDFDEEPNEGFKDFIKDHASSLTHLKLINAENFVKFFENFKLLKSLELTLGGFSLGFNFRMESVEELSLTYADVEILAPNFPNLRAITLDRCDIKGDIIEHLPRAEKLTLRDCIVSQRISLSKLKFLTIENCSNLFGSLKLNESNLKGLVIIGNEYHKWIENFLDGVDTKLESLKVIGPQYQMRLENVIKRNKHKISNIHVASK